MFVRSLTEQQMLAVLCLAPLFLQRLENYNSVAARRIAGCCGGNSSRLAHSKLWLRSRGTYCTRKAFGRKCPRCLTPMCSAFHVCHACRRCFQNGCPFADMTSMSACEMETYNAHRGELQTYKRTCDGHIKMQGEVKVKVWYNRVPKCGSTTMLALLERLKRSNCFRSINSGSYLPNASASHEQVRKSLHESGWMDGDPPCNDDGHSIFTNHMLFTALSNELCAGGSSILPRSCRVARINLVRDPIPRFASAFHYALYGNRNPEKRAASRMHYMAANGRIISLREHLHRVQRCPELTLVTYFCGYVREHPECADPTTEAAFRTAKRHVLEYDVVGVLENMSSFVDTLEHKLPEIFAGLTASWAKRKIRAKVTNSKIHQALDGWSYSFLERCFRNDIRLYAFIRDLRPNADKTGKINRV